MFIVDPAKVPAFAHMSKYAFEDPYTSENSFKNVHGLSIVLVRQYKEDQDRKCLFYGTVVINLFFR